MTEALGVAGHGGMKEFTDLTLEYSVLVDQVAAVAAEQLDGEVVVGPGRFGEAEALGGGAEDGGQVGVVGFVAGVGGLAILLGGEGMDEARLVAGLAKGELDGPMVFAGALDGDHDVLEVVLERGLAEAIDGGLKVAAAVGQGRGFQQHAAVEVGQEVPGARFGAVDGDDAEVFGSDLLNAGHELPAGLLQDEALPS